MDRDCSFILNGMSEMTTVAEATRIVLAHARDFGMEHVAMSWALGRVLKESLIADRDFPPFDRVAMDGIALRSADFAAGQRTFRLVGLQAAGQPRQQLEGEGTCIEVMTGAVLPQDADAVVRYEDVEIVDQQACVQLDQIKPWQNVHRQGTDRRQGDVLVQAPRLITPAEVAVAATIGKAQLPVANFPRVVIISTGDELVDVEAVPLPHQIRKSNVHALASVLKQWGMQAALLHLPDQRDEVRKYLDVAMERYDLIILSGAVSKGKFDYVPSVLELLGAQQLFHRVTQRPGKPFWFGIGPHETTIFALPGNPVSSFMCMHRYVLPWLRACWGLDPFSGERAMLAEDFTFKPDLTLFLPVKLTTNDGGQLCAYPRPGHGSGDLANLTDADAFLELPRGRQKFAAGEVFSLHRYRLMS